MIGVPMNNDILELSQNAAFLDELYEKFLTDPSSVDASWRRIFESGVTELPVYVPRPNGHHLTNGHPAGETQVAERRARDYEPRFARVYSLVDAYRKAG